MKIKDLRQHPEWIILGAVIVAGVVGGGLRLMTAQTPASSQETASDQPATAESENLFESPMVPLSTQLGQVAEPTVLLASTSSEERVAGIQAGRLDPFAPVTQAIAKPRPAATPASPGSTGTTPQPAANGSGAPTLPTASVSATPDLPPLPAASWVPPVAPLPAIPVANTPLSIPALPTYATPQAIQVPANLAETIELSGVVQVGDRVGVIVREANGATSRHIFVGDYLAGGQVLVKAIDLSTQEPLVILEYQGEEYSRMVGSGGQSGIS